MLLEEARNTDAAEHHTMRFRRAATLAVDGFEKAAGYDCDRSMLLTLRSMRAPMRQSAASAAVHGCHPFVDVARPLPWVGHGSGGARASKTARPERPPCLQTPKSTIGRARSCRQRQNPTILSYLYRNMRKDKPNTYLIRNMLHGHIHRTQCCSAPHRLQRDRPTWRRAGPRWRPLPPASR